MKSNREVFFEIRESEALQSFNQQMREYYERRNERTQKAKAQISSTKQGVLAPF